MRIHFFDQALLPHFNKAIVTVGSFDGVHKGHVEIIRQMKALAQRVGGETVLVSFHPHPRKIIGSVPGDIKLLNTQEEKNKLLAAAGVDHLVIVPFNHHFANQSAADYVQSFLYPSFLPHTVVLGYDHRFGKERKGDYQLMESMGAALGFAVTEIDETLWADAAISSTRVRKALLENELKTATELLGYSYFFTGTVVRGNQLGRTLGFPTANLHIASEEKLIPGNGVYAVHVALADGRQKKGMMNIGVRPTVDGKKRVIEVNLFDFDEEIYGMELAVSLQSFIRGEIKFDGLDALKTQLSKDRTAAFLLLS
ncbi:MAG: bifunctional riboflavin kinase/FAD synthetase [Sphingobacteriia bacterium]|nr:MAG: bifunctional riboflavin kinase/FAD synthetase [Sphingobacteriia bacterium]